MITAEKSPSLFWTAKKVSMLNGLYRKKLSRAKMAEIMGIPMNQVAYGIHKYVKTKHICYKPFTKEEDDFLRANYGKAPVQELLCNGPFKKGRTVNSLRGRAKRLGIQHTYEEIKAKKELYREMYQTMRICDIARQTGSDYKTISYHLKQMGLVSKKEKISKKWTEEETRKLIYLKSKKRLSSQTVAIVLDKTPQAVFKKWIRICSAAKECGL